MSGYGRYSEFNVNLPDPDFEAAESMAPEAKEEYLNELKGKSRFFRAFESTYSSYFGNLSK